MTYKYRDSDCPDPLSYSTPRDVDRGRAVRKYILLGCLLSNLLYAGGPLFTIRLALGEPPFPTSIAWYGSPITRYMTVINSSGQSMPSMSYQLPPHFSIDSSNSTCKAGETLSPGAQCQLAVIFNPDSLGKFSAQLQACAKNTWCSHDPIGINLTVTNQDIVSTQCNQIQSRPFGELDCASSKLYSQNFYTFLARVLQPTATPFQQFQYFQHTPSVNETTQPCLEAMQSGVSLDPSIQGGGVPLCALMAYATTNSSPAGFSLPITGKQYPPYLTLLLGTGYPITQSLNQLNVLHATFGQMAMDTSVQELGYSGFIDFLSNYYYQQQNGTHFTDCGHGVTCPSIYYLPYLATSESTLESWPPSTHYWGMSGGGGSGAGYQIEAFLPSQSASVHYSLFSGGGGGGGGNTTPENLPPSAPPIALLNTGAGGGGGSQFSSCYTSPTPGEGNLNGLGLGAGTGSGLTTLQGGTVTYALPPPTDYSYYPPVTHPTWNNNTILDSYVLNLYSLFHTVIPRLYNEGYTIAITGGGGGGSGFEFLDAQGEEFQPHPVSIGYGFNFCYLFNKNQQYHPRTDCASLPSSSSKTAISSDNLIYKNIGTFYNDGMTLAVPLCQGGYENFQCTCTIQHAYVICKTSELLTANGYKTSDIPSWLKNPHCNDTPAGVAAQGAELDLLTQNSALPKNCAKSIQSFYQTTLDSSMCSGMS